MSCERECKQIAEGEERESKYLLGDVNDGQGGGGLLVDYCAEASLALDNAVGHVALTAEGGEPDNELWKRKHAISTMEARRAESRSAPQWGQHRER